MAKKKNKVFKIFFIIVILCVGGYFGYKYFFYNKPTAIKTVDKIEKYGYIVNSNATSYQKKLFSELKDILNEQKIDNSSYSKKIVQLFLTDLFTLSNKLTSSDIGGTQFVYSDYEKDFISTVQTGLYKNIQSNVDGNRNQDLPEVSSVEIKDIKESKFSYNKKAYEAYVVTATISYKKDLGYPSKYDITLIKNNDKYEIAKAEMKK